MKIKDPNFPQAKISLALVGEEYTEIIDALERLSIEVIKVKINNAYPKMEACHADLRAHHLGDKEVVVHKEDVELAKALKEHGFSVIYAKNSLCGTYPKSAALNAARIGDILLCNAKNLDGAILKYALQNNIKIIDCKQGYSRCATCIVSKNAVITADKSVYKALSPHLDTLLISQGSIRLGEGVDGLLGGASALIDKNTLAFCGDIKTHPDFMAIENFLKKHKINVISLTNKPLLDVGSIIVLSVAK